jgi:hypothetical protein
MGTSINYPATHNERRRVQRPGHSDQKGGGNNSDYKENVDSENTNETSHYGRGIIKADRQDKHGTIRRYRAIEEGDCEFPFKYYSQPLIEKMD